MSELKPGGAHLTRSLIITKHSMTKDKVDLLNAAIPKWAVKPHPTRSNMTAIHPMVIIERLNRVFGVGEWSFTTEHISHESFVQKTKTGQRDMFRGLVKGALKLPNGTIIEQFGGSSNDDLGDAVKGSATDALTKCASYLGVGASIYRGQGNFDLETPMTVEEGCTLLRATTSLDELKGVFISLPKNIQTDVEIVALKDELKNKYV